MKKVEFDYDAWNQKEMEPVDFTNDSRVMVYKDKKGNYIWSRGSVIATVKSIGDNVYIVSQYYMNSTGEYVDPAVTPVLIKSLKEMTTVAYDLMAEGIWEEWVAEYSLAK